MDTRVANALALFEGDPQAGYQKAAVLLRRHVGALEQFAKDFIANFEPCSACEGTGVSGHSKGDACGSCGGVGEQIVSRGVLLADLRPMAKALLAQAVRDATPEKVVRGSADAIAMQRCPTCGGDTFTVTAAELYEAEGYIACENCGEALYPDPTGRQVVYRYRLARNKYGFWRAQQFDIISDCWLSMREVDSRYERSVVFTQLLRHVLSLNLARVAYVLEPDKVV